MSITLSDLYLKSRNCFKAVAKLRDSFLFEPSATDEPRLSQLKEIDKQIQEICQEELTRETLTKLSKQEMDTDKELLLLQNLGATLDLLFRLDFQYKKNETEDQKEKALLGNCTKTLAITLKQFIDPVVKSGAMTLNKIISKFQYGSERQVNIYNELYGETKETSTEAWQTNFSKPKK